MTALILPVSSPAVTGWQLADWLDDSYQSAPAVAGIATITLDQLEPDTRWQLTHMVVGCTSSTDTNLRLYLDQPANGALRDGSSRGNFDVADWAMGLMVPPSRSLVAVWSGASNGAIATLTLQANILRQAAG